MDQMDTSDPSRILEQARKHLEALKQAGLSREALLALLEEDCPPQQQQIQQQQQQQQQQLQQQQQQQQLQQQQSQPPHPAVEGTGPQPQTPAGRSEDVAKYVAQAAPTFAIPNYNFVPSHQIRSSISSTASTSSGHDSILSNATGKSSVSSIGGPFGRGATPSIITEARYWCTSCDKTFKRKFDWKRHEEEFHERWRKYPCPNCNQSFWGPNTFNQHHKSAHGCKTCPHSDAVVKYMMKRRAWGCGFCAAMHGKLEKHYEHVAQHFEAGNTKNDWMHSNVIYGLLHQPLVLEAWRELLIRKEGKFNGHQPSFSWDLDNTGRAQGYVENEHPGHLQDFLEFFDGSKETAEKIARCAWGYCHIVLMPRPASTPSVMQSLPPPPPQQESFPPSPTDNGNNHTQVLITSQSRGLRRVASTCLKPISRRPSRRISSSSAATAEFHDRTPRMTLTPPMEQDPNNSFNMFISPPPVPSQHMQPEPMQIVTSRPLSLNKELPPAPLVPSPMDMDFNMNMFSPDGSAQMMKPHGMAEDWHSMSSLSSTLIEDQPMTDPNMGGQPQPVFPVNWEDLNHFGQPR
ncbi:hypothetical protein PG993_011694 [Apiospora rasikravindrae]|uniref:C2H2-type domain-containing protein n=1 Tax=Apiospora rasikravindrae TaxID=990691 RepID=A0ABR1S0G2_9PEZI